MNHLTLYGTSACHLCEEAAKILDQLKEGGLALTYEEIDIANDDALFAAYGLTIPVIRNEQGREINWPFTPESVIALLAR